MDSSSPSSEYSEYSPEKGTTLFNSSSDFRNAAATLLTRVAESATHHYSPSIQTRPHGKPRFLPRLHHAQSLCSLRDLNNVLVIASKMGSQTNWQSTTVVVYQNNCTRTMRRWLQCSCRSGAGAPAAITNRNGSIQPLKVRADRSAPTASCPAP